MAADNIVNKLSRKLRKGLFFLLGKKEGTYLKEDLTKKFEHGKYWRVSSVFENDPKYLLLTTSDDELHLLVWQEQCRMQKKVNYANNSIAFQ